MATEYHEGQVSCLLLFHERWVESGENFWAGLCGMARTKVAVQT